MTDDVKRRLVSAEGPQQMGTANGLVAAHNVLPMRVGRLARDIEPDALEDTPDVLAIGGRCVNEGHGCYWPPYSNSPYFELPDFKNHGKRCSLISSMMCRIWA